MIWVTPNVWQVIQFVCTSMYNTDATNCRKLDVWDKICLIRILYYESLHFV